MMSGLDMRRPRPEDEQVLRAFFVDVLQDTFVKNQLEHMKDVYLEEVDEKNRMLKVDLTTHGRGCYFLVAWSDSQVAGTVAMAKANPLIDQCTQGALAEEKEIGTVFVHPRCQGQGIGKILVKTMLTHMQHQGIDHFCLDSGYPLAQKYWIGTFGEPQWFLKDYWDKDSHHMVWHMSVSEGLSMLQ